MNHDRYLRIIRGENRSLGASAARWGLALAAGTYGAAVAVRNRMFDGGLRRSASLGRPVISVGNLTAGGTGKTPMVIELVRRLRAMGHRPAVLLRGYGDDETRELQSAFVDAQPAVPVEANPDRTQQARALLGRRGDVTVFVLDDAFQHRQVHRDLDLVLVDATQPFGHDRLLPRGLLREPARNLRRADAVIVTRSDQVSDDERAALDQRIAHLAGHPPIAHTGATWSALRYPDGEADIDVLRQQRVVGACGIGNAGAFERQLRAAAGAVLDVVARGDHHAWQGEELRGLLRQAADDGAEAVVTTEKDWVKWQPLLAKQDDSPPVPICRPVLAVRFLDGEDAFVKLLQERLDRPADSQLET